MRRRGFLKIVAVGVTGAATGRLLARGKDEPRVITVRGAIPASRLGRTLVHEHVLVDFVGADQINPSRYDPEEVFRLALPHFEKLKAAGGQTFVDCTPAYLGRDARLLRRLAEATGLNVLTCTGFYGGGKDKYLPAFVARETADEIALGWAREFEDGIPPDNVRPGIMKIGVDAAPLSAADEKLVRAAARCHRRTGLAIVSHTPDGAAAMAQLEVLKEEGVEASDFIWAHAQKEKDAALHERAAKLGAWVEFDGIAPETLAQHVDLVMHMKRAGQLHRVLISQDAGWYHVGEPHGGDFRGYDFLFTGFLPALRKAGASRADTHTLTVKNPREALALRAV